MAVTMTVAVGTSVGVAVHTSVVGGNRGDNGVGNGLDNSLCGLLNNSADDGAGVNCGGYTTEDGVVAGIGVESGGVVETSVGKCSSSVEKSGISFGCGGS